MHKFVQLKDSNTAYVLDRSHGLNEIAGFQVQNRRCQLRYRFGQALSTLDRSILLTIAGLFLSVSAFAQTPGIQIGPYPTRGRTTQFPSEQDQPPVDSQLKLNMDRILAARVINLSSIAEHRRADFRYSKFAGVPESVLGVEDRKISGSDGSIPIQLYAPGARTGFPVRVFVAGGRDSYYAPLRAVTNRCDCPVVSVGYRLTLENRYSAASENTNVATNWVAEPAAKKDQGPRTLLPAESQGTFGFPPTPGSPQTPASAAYRAAGNIDLTALVAHFRVAMWFRRRN